MLNTHFDPAQRIIDSIVADHLSVLPASVAKWASKELPKVAQREGDKESRWWLKGIAQPFRNLPFNFAATDNDIIDDAQNTAQNMLMLHQSGASLPHLLDMASRRQVDTVPGLTEQSQLARLLCPLFWRRQLRTQRGRQIETIIRNQLGWVHRRKQIYISDTTLTLHQQQLRRNQALLEAITAMNDLGQSFTLKELSAVNVSNPAIRRTELIVRIAGFEHIAIDLNHVGEFVTITCPSRFHKAHAHSGAPNKKFDGSTPRAAQAYLQKTWAKVTAVLARLHIKIYGIRTAEPHHEGCPHWHCLFFMPKQHVQDFRRILALHFCREDRTELRLRYVQTHKEAHELAKKRRDYALYVAQTTKLPVPSLKVFIARITLEEAFWANASKADFHKVKARIDFKAIDWSKGSAVGYIIKYISKNIDGLKQDGQSAGPDFETDELTSMHLTALRVQAWASVWGIRQFQQIGGPPVGIWRELRRINLASPHAIDQDIERAAQAADKGDWGKYVTVMGGVSKARKAMPLTPFKDATPELNRYFEPRTDVLRGITARATGHIHITREHQWVLNLKRRVAPAWTCVNNSTESNKKTPQPPIHEVLGRNFHSSYPVSFDYDDFIKYAPSRELPDFDFTADREPLTPTEIVSINQSRYESQVFNQPEYKEWVKQRSQIIRQKINVNNLRKKHFPLEGLCGQDVSFTRLGLSRYTPGEYKHLKPKRYWRDYSPPKSVEEQLNEIKALINQFKQHTKKK